MTGIVPIPPHTAPFAPGPTAQATFTAFAQRVTADPAVLGLVLKGSQAHQDMPTAHSDYDLYVIVDDQRPTGLRGLDGFRSAHLDLVVVPLSAFRTIGLPGDPTHWERYAFVHAQVLLDRCDGLITQLVARKAALEPDEARQKADDYLDGYVNSLYRSLKGHRDGQPDAAHLDAAESVPHLLTVLFALHHRVRPYNKYLRWELERQPLGATHWDAAVVLPRLRRILADGDANTQRELFADIETAARSAGHDAVLDSWGSDLQLLRHRA